MSKGDIQVDYLNQISFPNDFLWMHGSDVSVISGHKIFKGALSKY